MKKIFKILFLSVGMAGSQLYSSAQVFTDSTKAADGMLTYAQFNRSIQPVPLKDALHLFSRLFRMRPEDNFKLMQSLPDEAGYRHDYYQQYYKEFKVEGAMYAIHSQAGLLESMNGTFAMIKSENIRSATSEARALASAMAFMPAQQYQWQVTGAAQPKGELVIIKDRLKTDSVYRLAYKFIIESAVPPVTKALYVDASTAEVINHMQLTQNNHLNATGFADTRYSGKRQITSELHMGKYRLRETRPGIARGTSVRIETMSMFKKGTDYNKAFDFTDDDNQWTAAEFDNLTVDNAALDVHWGTEKVVDYFMKMFGRYSFDGKSSPLYSYVHYTKNWQNASWDGLKQVMRYGDGFNGTHPFTSLDIVAHEIGHGVCQHTPYGGLLYLGESGALNEGFSDIWAAAVENHYAPEKQTWLIAEDVINNGLRNMAKPNDIKASSQCPDTYGGNYWKNPLDISESNDYGGVHINSGIINHWFYLLTVGGIGVNDLGNEFELTGIGINKAAKIAYRAEVYYLKPDANFNDARIATIHAARDLYGDLSPESRKVAHAWYAVGVGNYSTKQGQSENPSPFPSTGLDVLPKPQPLQKEFLVYPNPASQVIHISVKQPDDAATRVALLQEIQLLDESGKIRRAFKLEPHSFETQLDVAGLQQGMYYLRIFDGKSWTKQKVMIR